MKPLRLCFFIFICHISFAKAQYYEWAKSFPSYRGYSVSSISSDASNNTYMTSRITYSLAAGGKVEIKKFDSSGTGLWFLELPADIFGKLGISNITTDIVGNSYVVIKNPGPNQTVKIDNNLTVSYLHFVLKISPTGAILRVDSLPENQYFTSIIADSIGSLFLTDGYQTRKQNKYGVNTWINPLVGGSKLGLDNQNRVFIFQNDSIFKLNNNGITLWSKKYNGNDFSVDKTGNIYIASDDSIYKLNGSGSKLWSNVNYHGKVISLDPSGKIYLAEGTNTYKLSNSGSLLKWTIGSVNAEIQKISATDQSCFIAGGYDSRSETSFCPFHFTKLYTSSQSFSNWSFLTKINQSTNMPFQAGIYTPAILDDFLCAGISSPIPYVVCTNSNSSFGINNEFRAQLSDSLGNFNSNIIDLGLASNAFIPLSIPKGNNYRVRVVSTNPVVIGDPNSYGYYQENLKIDPITADIINTTPASLCSGDTLSLNALVADSSKVYGWYFNDTSVTQGLIYKLKVTKPGEYRLRVMEPLYNNCFIYSDSVVVNSFSKPTAPIVASGPLSFCTGDSVIFTTSAGNIYQWKKNNTNISGATFQNYTAKSAGNYKVKVTNGFGCTKISSGKTVTVICKEEQNAVKGKVTFKIFPNPFSCSFTLDACEEKKFPLEINIYDLAGRRCEQKSIAASTNIITLGNNLEKGFYIVETSLDNILQRIKVLKE